jgi:tetratricopeptide (TPR) repeat protein
MAYLVKAGDKARAAFANQDAIAYFDRAIAIVEAGHLEGDRAALIRDLRARKGRAFYQNGKWAEARIELEAALADPDAEGDDERAAALLDLGLACFWLLDTPAARRYASEAEAIARRTGAESFVTTARALFASIDAADGDIEGATEKYRSVLDRIHVDPAGVPPRLVDHYTLLAYWIGDSEEAITRAEANVRVERERSDFQNLMQGLPHLGISLAAAGRYAEAMAVFDEARAVGLKYEIRTLLARAVCMSTGMLAELGDYLAAEQRSEEAREIARSSNFQPPLVSSSIDLLLNYARRRDVGRADALIEDVASAVSVAAGWHGWLWGLRFTEARAELALARGDMDGALELTQEAIEQCRVRHRRKYEALAHVTRAAALAAKGRHAEAASSIALAFEIARASGDPALIVRAASSGLAVSEDPALVTHGREAVERVLGSLPAGSTRGVFENSEAVRALRR